MYQLQCISRRWHIPGTAGNPNSLSTGEWLLIMRIQHLSVHKIRISGLNNCPFPCQTPHHRRMILSPWYWIWDKRLRRKRNVYPIYWERPNWVWSLHCLLTLLKHSSLKLGYLPYGYCPSIFPCKLIQHLTLHLKPCVPILVYNLLAPSVALLTPGPRGRPM